jgi:putative membrane protein
MKISKFKILFAAALFSSFTLPSVIHAQQAPTDANIGAIVLAANQIDIDYAKLTLSKSKNTEVRAFAEQMVTDHSAVQKSVVELAGQLHLTPVDDDTSKGLKKQSVETTAKLKSLDGEAFDKAYVDNEVAYHKLVTDAVATVLIPNAKNPQLKSALQGANPLFLGHLEHARKIQAVIDPAARNAAGGR